LKISGTVSKKSMEYDVPNAGPVALFAQIHQNRLKKKIVKNYKSKKVGVKP